MMFFLFFRATAASRARSQTFLSSPTKTHFSWWTLSTRQHKANGLRAPSLCERWCISVCVHVCVSVSFCVIQSVCELAALKGGIITGKLSVCFNSKADEVDPPPDQLTPHTCRRSDRQGP